MVLTGSSGIQFHNPSLSCFHDLYASFLHLVHCFRFSQLVMYKSLINIFYFLFQSQKYIVSEFIF